MSKCCSPLGLKESDDLAVEQKQNELIFLVAQSLVGFANISKSQYYVIFLILKYLQIYSEIHSKFMVYDFFPSISSHLIHRETT